PHQVDASYEATICTISATSRPWPAPSAAAGQNPRSTIPIDERREVSGSPGTARRAVNEAREPNHSTTAASSGIAVGPNRASDPDSDDDATGSAMTEASEVDCSSSKEGSEVAAVAR